MLRRSFALLAAGAQGPFDPYKILGVAPGASKQDIKRAYHRLALRFHPDGGPEGNAERFNAVHEAYEAVKDGKWTQTAEQQRSSMKEGHGWDPKTRMYVYEQPGSTTENYVNSHTQTLLRLAMVWCLLFVLVRFLLLAVFPNNRPTPSPFAMKEASPAAEPSANAPKNPSSIHNEDEEEAAWSVGARGKRPAVAIVPEEGLPSVGDNDPLSGRRRVH